MMNTVESAEYYHIRKLSAVAMSQAASEPYIERLHLAMARRYDDLAENPDCLVKKENRDLECELI